MRMTLEMVRVRVRVKVRVRVEATVGDNVMIVELKNELILPSPHFK